jgi:hypothetical protein
MECFKGLESAVLKQIEYNVSKTLCDWESIRTLPIIKIGET